jgi:quercetin dioxygenase-like cupin family protein
MKRLSRDDALRTAQEGDRSHFTGPITSLPVHESSDPQSVRALVVGFQEGARTHWHRHTGGQLLQVIEGRGRTQSRGGPVVELAPGDLVSVPPGEEHWHGAAEGASMSHLAISLGTTDWGGAPD